jgi:hypothetical protein
VTDVHEHPQGECFCQACRNRARLKAPTLFGFLGRRPREATSLVSVYAWCTWCANWHIHGDHTNQPGDILHRYPHCGYQSGPYREHGYLVAVTNIPLAKVYGRVKRSTFEQRQIIGDGRTTPAIERLRGQVLPVLLAAHHGGAA